MWGLANSVALTSKSVAGPLRNLMAFLGLDMVGVSPQFLGLAPQPIALPRNSHMGCAIIGNVPLAQ
jgi:hypothetical protein